MGKNRALCILLIMVLLYLLFVSGCKKQTFDSEQVYHQRFEELEQRINSELGDYLTIVRYQTPDDDHLYIEVFFRSSYCDSNDYVDETPMWLVADRFRCICNDFLQSNPEYFGDDYSIIDCVFERDVGGYTETVASIRNYITSRETYDLFVTESIEFGDVDYSLLEDKDDIIGLYLGYHGSAVNPTTDECFNYFCDQIERFPNLEYIYVLPIFSPNVDNQTLMQMLLAEYDDLSEL